MTDERDPGDAGRAAAFDREARAVHAQAVAAVPQRALRVLRAAARGEAGTATPRPARVPVAGWALAGTCAVALALGFGLRQGPGLPASGDNGPALAALDAADADAAAATDGALTASFDEDPDLYLWLASADAQSLAME